MLNGYEICLNTTIYSFINVQDISYVPPPMIKKK